MLKKSILIGCILLLMGTKSFADDYSVSIGLKAWYNEMKITNSILAEPDHSSPVILIGPSLKLKINSFIGGISYLTTIEDEYDRFEYYTTEIRRQDIDLLAGYMLHPRAGLLATYKKMTLEYYDDLWWNQSDQKVGGSKTQGLGLGGTLNVPLGQSPIVFLATYIAYPKMDRTYSPSGTKRDYEGSSFDLGIVIGGDPVAVNFGYRIQEWKSETGYKEEFSGFFAGVDYRF